MVERENVIFVQFPRNFATFLISLFSQDSRALSSTEELLLQIIVWN